MKRTLSVLLIILILLSMISCGEKSVEQSEEGAIYYMGSDVDRTHHCTSCWFGDLH